MHTWNADQAAGIGRKVWARANARVRVLARVAHEPLCARDVTEGVHGQGLVRGAVAVYHVGRQVQDVDAAVCRWSRASGLRARIQCGKNRLRISEKAWHLASGSVCFICQRLGTAIPANFERGCARPRARGACCEKKRRKNKGAARAYILGPCSQA